MMAMEQYELAYQIQKGDDTEIPMSLSTMKVQTDFLSGSDRERTLKILIRSKLHTVTGLNIEQQLDLPRWQLQEYLKLAQEVAKEEAPVLEAMETAAKQAGALKASGNK